MRVEPSGYRSPGEFRAMAFAICGGSQPPIGTPGVMPQSRAITWAYLPRSLAVNSDAEAT